jgi:hypothetical protein
MYILVMEIVKLFITGISTAPTARVNSRQWIIDDVG